MKKLFCLAAALLLTGCAQWETMTPQQKNMVIATTAAGLVIGYYANDGDDVINQVHKHECRGRCDD